MNTPVDIPWIIKMNLTLTIRPDEISEESQQKLTIQEYSELLEKLKIDVIKLIEDAIDKR